MNRTVALITGCLLSLTSLGAGAQAPGVALRVDSGFYVGAGLGRSETRDICNVGGACDDTDLTWNVAAGYQFNRHFAVEAGYSDFGTARTTGFVGGTTTVFTIETKAFELVAVGILPFNDQFSVYAKVGVFRYDTDGTFTGGITGSASDKDQDLTFGLGAEYTFARQLSARFEWQRYFNVGSGVLGLPKEDIGVLRLGTRYRF